MPDFENLFDVEECGPQSYKGLHPLTKPHPSAKGVYGGNLVGQSILVAIRSSPKGFMPNACHSAFLKAVNDDVPMEWKVETVSTGKNFCNCSVRGYQDGDVKFAATVSLTKRNSFKKSVEEYEAYKQKEKAKEDAARNRAGADDDDDDDDDDDEPVPEKPFQFATPYPEWLRGVDIDTLPIDYKTKSRMLYHKIPKKLVSLEGTEHEEKIPAAERKLAFFVRLGNDDVVVHHKEFQYAGLGVLSDSIFSTRLARVLRIPDLDLSAAAHYYFVSLDHSIYFHDDDFNVTDWLAFGFRAIRVVNNRFLLEGHMYNSKGEHFATIVQEGIVHFNGIERDAKL